MKREFPVPLGRGQKGIFDGLPLPYLKTKLGLRITPTLIADGAITDERKVGWQQRVWWWKKSSHQGAKPTMLANLEAKFANVTPGGLMSTVGAISWVSQLPDSGRDLAFRYECVSRGLGEYFFDVPFTELSVPQLREFSHKVKNATALTHVAAIHKWDLPREPVSPAELLYQYDPAIVCPSQNADQGETWSPPLAITFNLLKNDSAILAEIKSVLDDTRSAMNQPEPNNRPPTRTFSYENLMLWDLARWRKDAPDIFNESNYASMIERFGLKRNASKLSGLRKYCRKNFPQFVPAATST